MKRDARNSSMVHQNALQMALVLAPCGACRKVAPLSVRSKEHFNREATLRQFAFQYPKHISESLRVEIEKSSLITNELDRQFHQSVDIIRASKKFSIFTWTRECLDSRFDHEFNQCFDWLVGYR